MDHEHLSDLSTLTIRERGPPVWAAVETELPDRANSRIGYRSAIEIEFHHLIEPTEFGEHRIIRHRKIANVHRIRTPRLHRRDRPQKPILVTGTTTRRRHAKYCTQSSNESHFKCTGYEIGTERKDARNSYSKKRHVLRTKTETRCILLLICVIPREALALILILLKKK